jgi:hypothetical protein
MGPYMALIVPSSFYGIDAGLHTLSFSLGFNVHSSTNTKLSSCFEYRWLMIISKYFVGGGLWRLLNINLFITAARPLKSIVSLFYTNKIF